jgi:single-strand DNA-binding protein
MAGIRIAIGGNLTRDPRLNKKETVCSFGIANTPRIYDREENEWIDGEPSFYNVSVFGQQAKYAFKSLVKGQRVIVSGDLQIKVWTDDDGNDHNQAEIVADEVGVSLLFGEAKFKKGGSKSGDNDDDDEPKGKSKGKSKSKSKSDDDDDDEPKGKSKGKSKSDDDEDFDDDFDE